MKLLTVLFAATWLLGATAGFAQHQVEEAKVSFIFDGQREQIRRDTPVVACFAGNMRMWWVPGFSMEGGKS